MTTKKIIGFTSFTFSYLSKANLLALSLRKAHPDWYLLAVITDDLPPDLTEASVLNYFDEIIWSKNLPIENFESWIFTHNIVEACTAVKGPALKYILDQYQPLKVFYLDPDIAVFNPLDDVIHQLNHDNIILTPHQLHPDSEYRSIQDNEIGSLKFGIYNLGFIAVNNSPEANRFASWWSERLLEFCYDDIPNGLFTDQRWCDHVPVFFDKVHILKDPGYNVASWNLSNRNLYYHPNGTLLVNGYPLRFYHFTKLGPVGETMTSRYAKENIEVYELWEWYKGKINQLNTELPVPSGWWTYGYFDNGTPITSTLRKFYNQRADLQKHFSNPFLSEGYLRWCKENNIQTI